MPDQPPTAQDFPDHWGFYLLQAINRLEDEHRRAVDALRQDMRALDATINQEIDALDTQFDQEIDTLDAKFESEAHQPSILVLGHPRGDCHRICHRPHA